MAADCVQNHAGVTLVKLCTLIAFAASSTSFITARLAIMIFMPLSQFVAVWLSHSIVLRAPTYQMVLTTGCTCGC